jgi:general secretion pathway protein E
MVGEIRDVETAEVAVQASLTGHLVLSTVHTNDAVSAITRLRDMGIESFLIASTTKAIVAQRLVRRLCTGCKEAYQPDAKTLAMLSLSDELNTMLFRPKGCARCGHTGYTGRIGIYELIRMTDRLRELVHENASEDQMRALAFARTETLTDSGYRQVVLGATSLEEVLRVCRSDNDGGV